VIRPYPPCVVIYGLRDARAALAPGLPVTLLSAPGAGVYAGCGWWRAVIAAAGAPHDILDCADAPGRALEALRHGQSALVLLEHTPGRDAVTRVAKARRAQLLAARPPALDLADPDALRLLPGWLAGSGSV
jgi:hypothetical protein